MTRDRSRSGGAQLPLIPAGPPAGPPLEDKLRSELPPGRAPVARRVTRKRPVSRASHLKTRERGFYPGYAHKAATRVEPRLPDMEARVDPVTGEVFPAVPAARRVQLREAAFKTETSVVEWDASASCEHPYRRMMYTPAEAKDGKSSPALKTYVLHRCRRCLPCRQSRAAQWFYRMSAECAVASGRPRQRCARTWLMTLTMEPEWHDHIRYRAIVEYDRSGRAPDPAGRGWKGFAAVEFDQLPERERWRLLHLQYGRELKLFFKRVRKRLKTSFRYCCVTECHPGKGANAGQFHWHVLLHEIPGRPQLKQDVVEACWIAEIGGEAAWRLQSRRSGRFGERELRANAEAGRICSMSVVRVPQGAGRYLLKYLTKEADMPIAASRLYGQVDVSLVEPVIVDAGDSAGEG